MTVQALVEGCLKMVDACSLMKETSASARAELAGLHKRLCDQDALIEEMRLDTDAMRQWGERVEARRIAASKREDVTRAEMSERMHALIQENLCLAQRLSVLDEELALSGREISRLREEALETCSVSRSIMLQNSHTRMERELVMLRAKLLTALPSQSLPKIALSG